MGFPSWPSAAQTDRNVAFSVIIYNGKVLTNPDRQTDGQTDRNAGNIYGSGHFINCFREMALIVKSSRLNGVWH